MLRRPVVHLENTEGICALMTVPSSFKKLTEDFKHNSRSFTLQRILFSLLHTDISKFLAAFESTPHFLDEKRPSESHGHFVKEVLHFYVARSTHNIKVIHNLALLVYNLRVVILSWNAYFLYLPFIFNEKSVLLRQHLPLGVLNCLAHTNALNLVGNDSCHAVCHVIQHFG
jgi:hypothetical protein